MDRPHVSTQWPVRVPTIHCMYCGYMYVYMCTNVWECWNEGIQVNVRCFLLYQGQELCYICAQRAQRNVAMSFAEEVRERELQENEMWQEYERQQRELHNAKEQATKMRNARYAKDSAAFNYEVSAIQQVHRCEMV